MQDSHLRGTVIIRPRTTRPFDPASSNARPPASMINRTDRAWTLVCTNYLKNRFASHMST
jgi:hypothetical protein